MRENSENIVDKIINSTAIENIDPTDPLLKLIPGIVPEHIARYRLAEKFTSRVGKNDLVVDLASGRGYGSNILSSIFPEAQVLGIEIKLNYAQKAAQKYEKNQSNNISFVQGDVRQTPIAGDQVKLVTAFEIVEHLEKNSQTNLIKEIERILAPDGIAILSFPEPYSFIHSETEEAKRGKISNPHHLYEPKVSEILEIIDNTKLHVIEQLGQIIVPKDQFESVLNFCQKIKIPLWSIYVWCVPKDFTVQKEPLPENQKFLTHILILEKNTPQELASS